MVDMWTWSAGEHRSGVTDSEQRARDHIRAHLAAGSTARIEKVRAELGVRTISFFYLPTGTGWTATRTGQGITWQPLPPAAA